MRSSSGSAATVRFVFAELLFGVEKSARREVNLARLERFAAGVVVACTALEHGATLITNDGGLRRRRARLAASGLPTRTCCISTLAWPRPHIAR